LMRAGRVLKLTVVELHARFFGLKIV